MKLERTTILNAPLEDVFRSAEKYPLFVQSYQEREIIEDDGKNVTVKIGCKIFGRWFRWEGKGTKYPYTSIEYEQTEGLLKGLMASWNFSERNNQTVFRLTVKFSFREQLSKRFFAPFFYLLITSTMKNISNSLKGEVAACYPQ